MSAPLLQVQELVKHFPVQKGFFRRTVGVVRAVDGVSLSVAPGETLGVVGESGCGKTTLGRALLRLIEPDSGHVWFRGQDLPTLPADQMRGLRRHLQIIFQDPYSSLNPRQTVGQILGGPLRLHGLARTTDEADALSRDWLQRVGLQPSYVSRYPHEFSGGQRQRIGIARALALQPDFVVCDEAVSALDVSVRAQVLNLLLDLRDRALPDGTTHRLSYLFVTHDLSVVRHIADRVAVMYLGQVVELATRAHLFARATHPYTQALLSAVPQAHPGRARQRVLLPGDPPSPINPPSGCRFRTRCPLVGQVPGERCAREVPALREIVPGQQVACHLYDQRTEPVPLA